MFSLDTFIFFTRLLQLSGSHVGPVSVITWAHLGFGALYFLHVGLYIGYVHNKMISSCARV